MIFEQMRGKAMAKCMAAGMFIDAGAPQSHFYGLLHGAFGSVPYPRSDIFAQRKRKMCRPETVGEIFIMNMPDTFDLIF